MHKNNCVSAVGPSERTVEVVDAVAGLASEIDTAEMLLADLLRRLEIVSSQGRADGSAEPLREYSAPLASGIGAQAERIAGMRRRLSAQLSSLELP
ncbi:MAG TPA: hypothetical protein VFE72_12085 [Lysobacter sp.]|nr:hypothetical protein [Lysobacter sp.]